MENLNKILQVSVDADTSEAIFKLDQLDDKVKGSEAKVDKFVADTNAKTDWTFRRSVKLLNRINTMAGWVLSSIGFITDNIWTTVIGSALQTISLLIPLYSLESVSEPQLIGVVLSLIAMSRSLIMQLGNNPSDQLQPAADTLKLVMGKLEVDNRL